MEHPKEKAVNYETALEEAKATFANETNAMQNALRVIAMLATTKHMIMTSANPGSRLPGISIPTDPTRLTWRTARLAIAIVDSWDPAHYEPPIREQDGVLIGEIGVKWEGEIPDAIPYAPIHELGGVIPAHDVFPIRAKALRWFDKAGHPVFRKRAHIPDVAIHPRPYLSAAAADPEAMTMIEQTMGNALRLIAIKFMQRGTADGNLAGAS